MASRHLAAMSQALITKPMEMGGSSTLLTQNQQLRHRTLIGLVFTVIPSLEREVASLSGMSSSIRQSCASAMEYYWHKQRQQRETDMVCIDLRPKNKGVLTEPHACWEQLKTVHSNTFDHTLDVAPLSTGVHIAVAILRQI